MPESLKLWNWQLSEWPAFTYDQGGLRSAA